VNVGGEVVGFSMGRSYQNLTNHESSLPLTIPREVQTWNKVQLVGYPL